MFLVFSVLPQTTNRRGGIGHPQEGLHRRMNMHHDPPQRPVLSPHHSRTVLVDEQCRPRPLHKNHHHHHPHSAQEHHDVNRTMSRQIGSGYNTHDVTSDDDGVFVWCSSSQFHCDTRCYRNMSVCLSFALLLNRTVHVRPTDAMSQDLISAAEFGGDCSMERQIGFFNAKFF